MNLTRRTFAAASAASLMPASAQATNPLLTGVNLAGLEFGSGRLPGRLNHDYVAPTPEALTYFQRCGARVVRLPFLWERLQPDLDQPFDEAHWRVIANVIDETAARRMRLVLDPHQYGRRRINGVEHIIGESPQVSEAHFGAFWAELARRCANAPHVIFGLQNEPHDQDMAVLTRVHNAAIAAIRAAGARQLILAPGSAWSGAHSWVSSGNGEAALNLRDPNNQLAFDVHQYLDRNSSGTNAACAQGSGGRLTAFTAWARAHRKRGFLGEFGAGAGATCQAELTALLQHVADNRDVWIGWTAWAGGPWWPSHYPFALEPPDLDPAREGPQMAILRRFFE
jgi:endoglucanase